MEDESYKILDKQFYGQTLTDMTVSLIMSKLALFDENLLNCISFLIALISIFSNPLELDVKVHLSVMLQ